MLSHADRIRVITSDYYEQGFTRDGSMPSIVLLDGFTGAIWKVTRRRGTATLAIRPFARLSDEDTEALDDEGARLLAFVAADAAGREVTFV